MTAEETLDAAFTQAGRRYSLPYGAMKAVLMAINNHASEARADERKKLVAMLQERRREHLHPYDGSARLTIDMLIADLLERAP